MPLFSSSPTPVPEIIAFFQNQRKTVITLAGFSGAGYQYPEELKETILQLLSQRDPEQSIVNIGLTADGIGQAYLWAKTLGFTTSGIVSTAVLEFGSAISPECDYGFVVEDAAFGGYVNGRLSPVSEAMVSVSDLMIAVGGGEVARDELTEMEKRGKSVQFIPAKMNQLRALAKAWGKGLPPPKDETLWGAAHARFGGRPF